MRIYDLILITTLLSEKETEELLGKVRKLVQDEGGEVQEIRNIFKGKLAYPIKHERQGQGFNFVISIKPEKLNSLRDNLKLQSEILRITICHHLAKSAASLPLTSEKKSEIKSPSFSSHPAEKKSETPDLNNLNQQLNKILEEI